MADAVQDTGGHEGAIEEGGAGGGGCWGCDAGRGGGVRRVAGLVGVEVMRVHLGAATCFSTEGVEFSECLRSKVACRHDATHSTRRGGRLRFLRPDETVRSLTGWTLN